MKIVRTVTGDIHPEELGHTQCHEHIFIEKDKSAEINGALCIDDIERGVEELEAYRRAGGGAIVDAQPVMVGRMAEWEREASERSGVAIIASTGFHKTIFYYEDGYVFRETEDRIAELYVSEITEGMLLSRARGYAKSDVKAGIIKTAVDSGGIYADKTYEKLHTAAARAQRQTGAAVMCHMEAGADAAQTADFYLNAGVPADRLWLAHLDRANEDTGVHKDILARGCYLEFDTIAREKYHSDEVERGMIVALLDAGYADRLLLGLDTTRARLKSYGGAPGLDYILNAFIPSLIEAGATQAQIGAMMRRNPCAALAMEQGVVP